MMRKAYSRAEKLLLASPLLIFGFAALIWQRQRTAPISIEVPDEVRAMEFSPDGKKLAVFFLDTNNALSRGRVYDLESRSQICDLGAPTAVPSPNPRFVARTGNRIFFNWPGWSPDGSRLVASYSGNTQGTKRLPDIVTSNGKHLQRFNYLTRFAVWNAQTGVLEGDYPYGPPNENSRVSYVRFSPDGKTIQGQGTVAATFDAATGKRLKAVDSGASDPREGGFNPELGLMAVAVRNQSKPNAKLLPYRQLRVFDVKTNKVVWQPTFDGSFDFSWYGDVFGIVKTARATGQPPQILLWNGKTRQLMPSPPLRHSTYINGIGFRPDKRTLAFWNGQRLAPITQKDGLQIEGELVVWDYRSNKPMWRTPMNDFAQSIQWSNDGKWLAVMSSANDSTDTLLVFDKSGKLHLQREIAGYPFRWSHDGHQIAVLAKQKNPNNIRSGPIEIIRMGE